jgi:hypothetical protein
MPRWRGISRRGLQNHDLTLRHGAVLLRLVPRGLRDDSRLSLRVRRENTNTGSSPHPKPSHRYNSRPQLFYKGIERNNT